MLIKLTSGLFAAGLLTFAFLTTVSIPPPPSATPPPRPRKTMKAFTSEAEMKGYFRDWIAKQKRRRGAGATSLFALSDSVPLARAVDPSEPLAESVTNTQHAGVDEGDIVKLHGDHLVILRRGRLFTVAIGDDQLKPVSSVDAFGPDMDPRNTWYDEMLISSDTIAIIGYSYERGGTEVGLFNIDAQGQLSYRSTYHLRSDDYYSSRNYASRLIGSKLIFYSPLYVNEDDPLQSLPAVRKWHKGATTDEFHRIAPATRVYRPAAEFSNDDSLTLHTVTVCDLANGGFNCEATTVIGPSGNVFYVSPDSVYVWATSWFYAKDRERPQSILFRLPLDGSGPSALRVSGSPVDQFSFLQREDQYLNVLVRSEAKGDGMWAAEVSEGDVALMRIPLASFSDGSQTVPKESYRSLPAPKGDAFQNRFVGNYVIYGTGNGWYELEATGANPGGTRTKDLFLVNWSTGNTRQLTLPHGVDRIEPLGSDAVVVGTDGKNLHFTSIRLGQEPEVASRYTRPDASQGEMRSHGFFYKPEDADSGTLGLPISVAGRPGYHHLFEDSAAILFLRNEALQFRPIGELGAQPEKAVDDHCLASCVDWYGNARPLFLRGRVFALLGYELVEGRVDNGRIIEVRRVDYYGMRSA